MKITCKSLLLLLLCFASSSAFAQVSINAGSTGYNQLAPVQGISISSGLDLRMAALLSMGGGYRSLHGAFSLPDGTTIQVTYQNGSKEKAVVICFSGTPCIQPVPGTMVAPPSSGGNAGGGDSSGGGSSGGGGGYIGGGGCYGSCGGDDDLYGEVGDMKRV